MMATPERRANMWLLKTEPSAYSYADLEREGRTVWDGVKNPAAIRNLKAMKAGERALVYHTGDEKAAVGLAQIVREAYPDPKRRDARLFVVELAALGRLPRPVTLAEIKALPVFKDSPLVRQGRLSVVPLTAAQWKALEQAAR
jgi:predicted RNA-binding protein with PUA-like domain